MENINSLLIATLESTSDGILVVKLNGDIAAFNNSFLKIWNIPETITRFDDDKLIRDYAFILAKHPDEFISRIQEIYANPEIETFDIIELSDGRILERYSAPQILDKKIIGRVWNFRDKTIQAKNENALKESEEKFRKITSSAKDAIIMMNSEGYISFWNESAHRIFGYSTEEILGRSIHEVLAPERYRERFYNNFDYFKITGQGNAIDKTVEYYALRSDGTEFPIELSLSSLKIDGLWHAVGIIRDISDRKKEEKNRVKLIAKLSRQQKAINKDKEQLLALNKKLEESEKKLLSLNAAKDKFISILAHDIRNPFGAFKGLLESIHSDYDKMSDDEKKEIIAVMNESASSLFNLFENLMDWTGNQFGTLNFEPKLNNLKKIIENNMLLMKSQAQEKKISVINNVPSDLTLTFDFHTIDCVIRNLLSNAIKFTSIGGLIIIQSQKEIIKQKEYVKISFIDNGVGVNKEQISNLFEFGNQPTFGTSNEKGTGLGLLLVKDFIERNGGMIEVVSEPGNGSIFSIFLKLS